jgi:hypothetical protein
VIECKWSYADVATVLDPDAGNHANLPGLFASTHRPVPGQRSVAEGANEPIPDAGADAYGAIRQLRDDDWPVVIPVLGEPGTGKSHLVRWVWNELKRTPDESFAMVYIPRIRTNIAGVLERLLDAALKDPDEAVRAAAEDLLKSARATYQDRDQDRVARELRAEIVFQLKAAPARRAEMTIESPDASATPNLDKMVAALETILTEGSDFETYLHSQDSAIGRRVAVLVEGRPEERVHEVPAGFSADEVASYSPRVSGQSQKFQDAVRRLVSKQEWGSLELAASLLDEALDRAVSELIAKGTQARGLTFTEVFRRLRESLHAGGKELLIFVEELKLLGGIERELLESFLDNSAAEGLAPICRVRALIACTTGEWTSLSQDIGTLTSRLNAWRAPRYELDGAALSREEVGDRLLDMAAHYLNAARVGVTSLEAAFRGTEDASSWKPPNACDTCKVRKRCHDAFGTAGTGESEFGLFPFNPRALLRAQENVQLQQISTPLANGLNPRVLLTGVLTPMLKHVNAVEDGQFPRPPLARELNFAPAAEAAMRQELEAAGLGSDEADRGAVLLEIWGNPVQAAADGDLVSWTIEKDIPKMLGIEPPPVIKVRRTSPVIVPERPRRGGETTVADGLPAAVERWRNGTDLVSGERRDLRNRVNDLLLNRVDWNDFAGVGPGSLELLREAGFADSEQLIVFEETASELRPTSDGVRFEFRRTDDDYAFLNAVARPAAELQPTELVALAEGLEVRAAALEEQLASRGVGRGVAIDDEHPALGALAIASIAHGLDPGSTDEAGAPQVLAGLVAESNAVPITAAITETRELFQLLEQGVRVPRDDVLLRGQTEQATREHVHAWLLRRVGLRRSSLPAEDDQVQMLDGAAVYDAVLKLATSSQLTPKGLRKADAKRGESAAMANLGTSLVTKMNDSLAREIERSRSTLTELASVCGFDGSAKISPDDLTAAVDAAAAAAESADGLVRDEGMLPGGEIRGSYRKAADIFENVRAGADIGSLGRLYVELATSERRSRDRVLAAHLYAEFAPFNAYREASRAALTRGHVYLDHLTAYIPKHFEGSTNPIVEGFPNQYRLLLTRLAELLDELGSVSASPTAPRKKKGVRSG